MYVDRWISKISQTFGDAALDEQNTYLPEALLDRVGSLYALDLTARVVSGVGWNEQALQWGRKNVSRLQ